MARASRNHAILYTINCIADLCGAVFAIRSRQLFEFQEIVDRNRAYHESSGALL